MHHEHLTEAHLKHLLDSAIHPAIIQSRGYFSASVYDDIEWMLTEHPQLEQTELAEKQRRFPGIVIPRYNLGVMHHLGLRPDDPRTWATPTGKQKIAKYEWPKGVGMILDMLPMFLEQLMDRHIPLWITEGSKKADAIASHIEDVVPISINGTYGWQKKNFDDEHILLAGFDTFPMNHRMIVMAMDEDTAFKEQVRQAQMFMRGAFMLRGATVGTLNLHAAREAWTKYIHSEIRQRFITLPKWGIDDGLAAGIPPTYLRRFIHYHRLDGDDRRFWRYVRDIDAEIYGS